jgi:hypothetical protein
MKSKITYALNSLFHKFDGLHDNCPSCGSKSYIQINSKEFLKFPTSLRFCNDCSILYRHPTTLEIESKKFYENEYVQTGLTTDLPTSQTLDSLIQKNFSGSEKDFSRWVPLIEKIANKLGRNIRALDYGANWGYTVHQLNKLDCVDVAIGYEFSDARREYGEKKLGIKYISEAEFSNDFDLVFSSHVIEHMHNPSLFKIHMDKLLKISGFIVLTCPNGSMSAMVQNPKGWRSLWGQVHPNFISDLYLVKQFHDYEGNVFEEDLSKSENMIDFEILSNPPSSRMPASGSLIGVFRKK